MTTSSEIDSKGNNFEAVTQQVLEAVAMEERAIASLISAEAEMIKQFSTVKAASTSQRHITQFQSAVARIVEAITEKERLLIRKVEMINELVEEFNPQPNNKIAGLRPKHRKESL